MLLLLLSKFEVAQIIWLSSRKTLSSALFFLFPTVPIIYSNTCLVLHDLIPEVVHRHMARERDEKKGTLCDNNVKKANIYIKKSYFYISSVLHLGSASGNNSNLYEITLKCRIATTVNKLNRNSHCCYLYAVYRTAS